MKTLAIIVLYNPNLEELSSTVSDLTMFGLDICLVDNSEKVIEFSTFGKYTNLKIIQDRSNFGIAKAQNIGINYGMETYDNFLFLDQDSSLSDNFMIDSMEFLNNKNMFVQVPIIKNKNDYSIYPATVLDKHGLPNNVIVNDSVKFQQVDIGISSGTLVKSEVFKLNITFREELFIDFVDIEWFLNCKKNGISIFQNNRIFLFHLIGGQSRKVLNRKILVHDEKRIYYKTRNAFLLLKLGYNKIYVSHQIVTSLFFSALNVMFVRNKLSGLNMYLKGIWHGLSNKGGKQI